jgi:hypothetical protein
MGPGAIGGSTDFVSDMTSSPLLLLNIGGICLGECDIWCVD